MSRYFVLALCALSVLSCPGFSQQPEQEAPTPGSFAVTNVIRFSGVVRNAAGKPADSRVSITFSLYGEGGELLWSETQSVRTDRQGRYSVLLGAESGGVPVELFAGESARWLGARTPDGRESKTLLVSVPYALKAVFATSAETLGGQSAASFVTKEELRSGQMVLASGSVLPLAANGTLGRISKFTSSTDLGDSVITESGGNIGIATDTPERTLHVKGTSGALLFDAGALATNPVLFFAHDNFPSKFRNRVMLDRSNESMQIWSQNGPRLFVVGPNVGINTATPTQALDVVGTVRASGGIQFGDGSIQTTATTGGGGASGDITSVTAGSGLTGGGLTGDVSLGVDSTVARTTLPNAFAGNQTIAGNLVMNGSITLNVGLCPGTACKQLVLGGYTPSGGSSPQPQAGDGFGLNVLYPDGTPAVTMDTTGATGSAIQKAVQLNAGTAFNRNAPAALRGDANPDCGIPTPGSPPCVAYGVIGTSNTGAQAIGVLGWSTGGYGVYGITDSITSEVAVTGWASSGTGTGYGIWGNVQSPNATAGLFTVSSSSPGTLIEGARFNSSTGSLTNVFTVGGEGNVTLTGNLNVGGILTGNGSGLTNVSTSGLAAGTYGNAYTFSNPANAFTGDGSGLTSVTAAGLVSGTYANPYSFSSSSNTFTGNGSGLTSVTASGLAAGTYANAYNFSNPANVYVGDGSQLTGVSGDDDAATLGGVAASNYARRDEGNNLTGNQIVNGSVTVASGSLGTGITITGSNGNSPALTINRSTGGPAYDLLISKAVSGVGAGLRIENTANFAAATIEMFSASSDALNQWYINAGVKGDNSSKGLRIGGTLGDAIVFNPVGGGTYTDALGEYRVLIGGNLGLTATTANGRNGVITVGGEHFLHAYGDWNIFLGRDAGNFSLTGLWNIGIGVAALDSLDNGANNIAVGREALGLNTDGSQNVAIGEQALPGNLTGNSNVAVGTFALGNTTGDNNIGIGDCGGCVANGSNNILIGNVGSFESGAIRIGTPGTQTKTFVAGIRGATTATADAINVLIDSNGQLGTVSSSARVKFDIAPMAAASRRVLDLRPVTFRYKQPYADGSQPIQFGLIAEEVADLFPELAARNAAGEIETVKYHLLPVLLLNEVQRQQRELAEKDKEIAELKARMAAIEAALARRE